MTQNEFEAEAALDEADYEAIEAAVKETARGRAFLAEFARRNCSLDVEAQLAQSRGQVATLLGELHLADETEPSPDPTEAAPEISESAADVSEETAGVSKETADVAETEAEEEIAPTQADPQDPENRLIMETSQGQVVIALRPDLAPTHVSRIKELVRNGFYDGVDFHRVIEDFMAQTGDPTGTGTGGSGQKLKAEFSDEPHVRGTCAMARAQDSDSADSQFFICFADAPWLDGQYTVWGQVVEGMDSLDKIKRSKNGKRVSDPDKVVSMRVAADEENSQKPEMRQSG
jgi:cyclophilin family peptidyl-prolyl cis-trans isomerase